jgi:RluA family pseudouridine synthase
MMKKRTIESHIVQEDPGQIRIRDYIFEVFEILPTKKSAKKAVKNGEVLVNGVVPESGFLVKAGQKIELIEPQISLNKLYELKINVIFEDEYIAVVEKPPGIPVNGNFHRTLENTLPLNLTKSSAAGPLVWPSPVHRLDKSTGGLVMVGKTYESRVKLGWQFQSREVKKRYMAIVMGKLTGEGTLNDPIENRNAITHYKVIKSIRSIKNDFLTLVNVYPETGRYHQIRRHFSSIGFPILGDKLYGPKKNVLLGKGLFLWAVELNFHHPIKNTSMNIKINEPEKFKKILNREESRWIKYNSEFIDPE